MGLGDQERAIGSADNHADVRGPMVEKAPDRACGITGDQLVDQAPPNLDMRCPGIDCRDKRMDRRVEKFGQRMRQRLDDAGVFGAAGVEPDQRAFGARLRGLAKSFRCALGRSRVFGARQFADASGRVKEPRQKAGATACQLPSSSVGASDASSSRRRCKWAMK